MSQNIYDYVLNMFKAKETLRTNLNEIFPNEDYYCATDSHCLAVVPKAKVSGNYLGAERHPVSALDLIKNHEGKDVTHVDRASFLKNFNLAQLQWSKQYKNCEKCSGHGTVECKCCHNESDCKSCGGSGNSDVIKAFSEMTLEGENIKLFGSTFYSSYLNMILMASYFLETNIITIRYDRDVKNKAFIFEIADLKILLMPKTF